MKKEHLCLGNINFLRNKGKNLVTEDQTYRDLQKRLDKLPIGFPSTKSGVEIRILKHLFTPEEAELAALLSMIPEPLVNIHERIKVKTPMPIAELEQILGRMVKKGAITFKTMNNQNLYCLMPFAVGMYETQVNRLTRDFAQDATLYLHGEFGQEMYRTKIPQMRTIPVSKSIIIPEKFEIGTYDDIRDIIQNVDGQIGVLNCICRQNRNVIGE